MTITAREVKVQVEKFRYVVIRTGNAKWKLKGILLWVKKTFSKKRPFCGNMNQEMSKRL